jgi:hypothetical protein
MAEGACRVLQLVCQAIVYRELTIEQLRGPVNKRLNIDPQQYADPATHYSVDLAYRFLPQIVARAGRVSPDDPLLELLAEQLTRWPLSSVGSLSSELHQLPEALSHPTLWQMYIDRIIVHEDRSRLNVPQVLEAVQSALGAFPFLSPALGQAGLASMKVDERDA